MKRIEQKKYYKLSFSVDVETPDDVDWVREQMQGLEREPHIMKCFQNVRVTNIHIHTLSTDNAFSIYFKEENNKSIEKFLFKVRLKFPNFRHEITQTVKEYA